MKPTSATELTVLAVVLCALLLPDSGAAVPLPQDLSDAVSDLEIGRWLLRFLHANGEAPTADKRRPLSVNQDLMSLADMLQGDAGKKKMLHAQSFLNSIGKRAQEAAAAAAAGDQESPFMRLSRGGRLSVGIPLRTLSSMIADQRRRKSAASVSSHLGRVGKRDVSALNVRSSSSSSRRADTVPQRA